MPALARASRGAGSAHWPSAVTLVEQLALIPAGPGAAAPSFSWYTFIHFSWYWRMVSLLPASGYGTWSISSGWSSADGRYQPTGMTSIWSLWSRKSWLTYTAAAASCWGG